MIFRRMRSKSFIPTNGGRVIGEGHVRIIWASWHVLTVFGWLIGAALVWLAAMPVQLQNQGTLLTVIAAAMLVNSALVFIATKGRHPGWVGLLAVAALTWLGQGT